MLVVVFVSEGKLQSSGDNQQWIQEEERRRRVSISRHSIKLSNVWPPGNFSAHHLGCSCLVSRSCLPRTHQHCYCQCPPSSWRPPPSIFALNALGKNLQVKIILAMEYRPWPSDITNQHIAYLSYQPIM